MAKIYQTSLLFRKITCIFLIGVFVFGITPVAWLHDLVSNHKDVCYHNFHQQGNLITKADINCRCISFVAETQFLNNYQPILFTIHEHESHSYNSFYTDNFYSQYHFFAELRGPPSFS